MKAKTPLATMKTRRGAERGDSGPGMPSQRVTRATATENEKSKGKATERNDAACFCSAMTGPSRKISCMCEGKLLVHHYIQSYYVFIPVRSIGVAYVLVLVLLAVDATVVVVVLVVLVAR